MIPAPPLLHTSTNICEERTMNKIFYPSEKQADMFAGTSAEAPEYLSEQLITYIGNKRKLLPMIEASLIQAITELGIEKPAFADVFAGTGVVSRMARSYACRLFINDFEEYSSYSNQVYHVNRRSVPVEEIECWRHQVNQAGAKGEAPGFITELYAPANEDAITTDDRVFYTRRNAAFIDSARAEINKAPQHIQPFLLAPLLQRASVHVNTSGVFKGFYKNKLGIGQFGGTMKNALSRIMAEIEIPFPVFSRHEREVKVSCMDAVEFINAIPEIDIAYFDPPYNQHPYGSNYFMLNLILKNERPQCVSKVSGIPKTWQRSPYNVRSEAGAALAKIVHDCPAKALLVSYNSEGFIAPDEMMSILEPIGEVQVFDQLYNTFRGCRNLSDRSTHVTEMLFKVVRS